MFQRTDDYRQQVDALREVRRAHAPGSAERLLAESAIAARLDRSYWEAARAVVEHALTDDPTRFAPRAQERFLLDTGLLDDEILEEPAPLRAKLHTELRQPGTDADCLLSEFLSRRYDEYQLVIESETPAAPAPSAPAPAGEIEAAIVKAQRDRKLLLPRLKPLLTRLPGMSAKIIDLVTTGQLDERIEALQRAARGAQAESMHAQAAQFEAVRAKVFEPLKALTASSRSDAVLVEAVERLGATIGKLQDRLGDSGVNAGAGADARTLPPSGPASLAARIEFLHGELNLVKSLLKLLAGDARIRKGHSVLVRDEGRLTKADIAHWRARIAEADPGFPGRPLALLVPFNGTGKFEWDRNTMLLSMRPDGEPEQTVLGAAANYRVMIDTLQHGGRLRAEYEKRLGGADFREQFVRDYRKWVAGVGAGYRGALEPERMAFFMANIGPNPEGPIGPGDLLALPMEQHGQALREIRTRLQKNTRDFDARFRLGVIYWLRKNRNDAFKAFEEAMAVKKDDPRLLFCCGALAKQLGSGEWKSYLRAAMQHGPKTLWSVYAGHAMG